MHTNNIKFILLINKKSLFVIIFDFINLSFQDTLNPICNCGTVQCSTVHYLPHCPSFSDEIITLFNKQQRTGENIFSKENSDISKVQKCLPVVITEFMIKRYFCLTASIEYIVLTKRFDAPLHKN